MKFNLQEMRTALDNYYQEKSNEDSHGWWWSTKEPVPEIIETIDNYCRNVQSLNGNNHPTSMQNYQMSKYLLALHDALDKKYIESLYEFEEKANEDYIYGDNAHESEIARILIQHDLYCFETYQQLTAYQSKQVLLEILKKLNSSLSDHYLFQVIINHKNPAMLLRAVIVLQGSDVPEKYHWQAYQHANPNSMAMAMDVLYKNHLLFDAKWLGRIIKYSDPNKLLQVLLSLPQELLNKKIIDVISLSDEPEQVAESIRTLYSAHLWNDLTYKYLQHHLEKNKHYQHQYSIFGYLQSVGLLTFPYIAKTLEHPNPEDFAVALKILSAKKQLEYLPNVFSHSNPRLAANLINYLILNHGLNNNTLQCIQKTTIRSVDPLNDVTLQIPYEEKTFQIMLAAKEPQLLVAPFVALYRANIRDPLSKEIVAKSPDPQRMVQTLIDLQRQELLGPEVLLALKKQLPKKDNNRNLFLFGANAVTKPDGAELPKFRRMSFG